MNVIQVDSNKIKAAAAATGLTVRKIAARAGIVSHSTVANVLNGEITPSATNLKRICDALDLPIEDVFIEKEIKATKPAILRPTCQRSLFPIRYESDREIKRG